MTSAVTRNVKGQVCLFAPATRPRRCARQPTLVRSLFGRGSAKDAEKEEQYKLQQEVLKRRKQGTWQKEVEERRSVVSRYMKDKDFKKQVDAEKRKRFEEKKAQEVDPPLFGSIIIPLAPFGIPEYDGGERFDLRGKYVDEGWVDEDADVFKKIKNFFGGKKEEEKKEKDGKNKK